MLKRINNFEVGGKLNNLYMGQSGKFWKNELAFISGKFKNGSDLYTGNIDFVVKNGQIRTGNKLGHKVLAEGGNVDWAGTLTMKDGKITGWDGYSGHYKPDENNIDLVNNVIETFKENMDINITDQFKPRYTYPEQN